jgi:NAD(P)H-hydrate epimerase
MFVALVFSGCALRTVEEMYSLPKRSEKYNKLQTAIDEAMTGLEYSAPTSGDNRQILQNADLDGDGSDEYIIFAKGETERPLRMLIFRQESDGGCTLIEDVSFRNTPVLAIDIPSGVHADSGRILGLALRATVTATMGEVKRGLVLYPAAEYVGTLRVCDIGISSQSLLNIPGAQPFGGWYITDVEDVADILYRPPHAHKGTFGRVVVMGGSYGMCGAPYFAAKSAYRAGAGLVEIFTDEAGRIPLQTLIPEAVLTLFSPDALPSNEQLVRLFDRADSVVLGCGLGQSDAAYHIVEATLRLCTKPLVLDADALNLIALHKPLRALMTARSAPTVITPHMGEAARLSGRTVAELAADPFASASDLAEQYNAVCVLKDARTVTSNGKRYWVQSHGNNGMATGGSGDCLAGLIGCLYAKTRNWEATPGFFAAAGVIIHAKAGDHAARNLGQHAVMASDIADAIGEVLRDIP